MDDLLELATGLPRRTVARDETLISDGESASALFVLIDGALRVDRAGVQIATVTIPGTCVGEMALLLGVPATAAVVASEPSTVVAIENAPALLHSEPGLAIALARLLAARLHVMTTYLVDLKLQYADHEGGLGMIDVVLDGLMRGGGARSV